MYIPAARITSILGIAAASLVLDRTLYCNFDDTVGADIHAAPLQRGDAQ
jgi:hypothetical protein